MSAHRLIPAFLSLMLILTGQPHAQTIEERAREVIALLVAGNYPPLVAQFSEQMKAGLPAEQLETVWNQLQSQVGGFQGIDTVVVSKQSGHDVAVVTLAMEQLRINARIAYNQYGTIVGLFFQAAPPKTNGSSVPAYADTSRYAARNVTIGEAPYELGATLTLPISRRKVPAVVLVHGSGPSDRNSQIGPNAPFRDLASGLSSIGMAVLRYDKRTFTYGAELAAMTAYTVDDEVTDDAVAAITWLRQQPEIDSEHIYLVGHSLGGYLAPRIASRVDVAGLILLAAPARSLLDLMEEQYAYIVETSAELSDMEREVIEQRLTTIAVARNVTPQTSADSLPFGIVPEYWIDLQDYEPHTTLAGLDVPTLLIFGERDYQVPLAEEELWTESVGDLDRVTIRRLPGLNHLLMMGEGLSTAAEYERPGFVDRSVIETIGLWHRDQIRE